MLFQTSPDWITDTRTRKQYLRLNTGHFKHDDIQKKCYDHGGFLPEPRDWLENRFLCNLGSKMFALGMSDRLLEGTWRWESDGTQVTWTKWYPGRNNGNPKKRIMVGGEPTGGSRDNCAVVRRVQLSWIDAWQTYECQSRTILAEKEKSLICQRNTGMCVLLLV